jgi:hypothetical protein
MRLTPSTLLPYGFAFEALIGVEVLLGRSLCLSLEAPLCQSSSIRHISRTHRRVCCSLRPTPPPPRLKPQGAFKIRDVCNRSWIVA